MDPVMSDGVLSLKTGVRMLDGLAQAINTTAWEKILGKKEGQQSLWAGKIIQATDYSRLAKSIKSPEEVRECTSVHNYCARLLILF